MKIRRYNKFTDEEELMKMIENEEGWDYANESNSEKYKKALEGSITFVAHEKNKLCGFSRSIVDPGFYVYVCDLLVRQNERGLGVGRKLMACLCDEYPDHIVYVMSDVDRYYEKLNYKREGSIFEVQKN